MKYGVLVAPKVKHFVNSRDDQVLLIINHWKSLVIARNTRSSNLCLLFSLTYK